MDLLSVRRLPWLGVFLLALGVASCFAYSRSLMLDEFRLGILWRNMFNGLYLHEYFPGQHYMGCAEGFLPALAYRLLGAGWFSLRVGSIICWPLAVVIVFHFWGEDRLRSLIAALLLVVAPSFVADIVCQQRGYILPMLLCSVLMLLCAKSRAGGFPAGIKSGLLFGFLMGLGYWCNPQTVVISFPVALALGRHWLSKAFCLSWVGAVVLGLGPAILHWFRTGIFMKVAPPALEQLLPSLAELPKMLIMALGVPEHPSLTVRLLASAVFLALLLPGLAACAWDQVHCHERRWTAVFWLSLVGGMLLYVLSGRLWAEARYVSMAYPAVAILAANGWAVLMARWRLARWGGLAALLAGLAVLTIYLEVDRKLPAGAFEGELRQAAAAVDTTGCDAIVGNERVVYGVAYFMPREIGYVTWWKGPEVLATFAEQAQAFPGRKHCAFVIVDTPASTKASGPKLQLFVKFMAEKGLNFPSRINGRIGVFDAGVGGQEAVRILQDYEAWAAGR